MPSANCHASARGLARLGVAMANDGKLLDGECLMSGTTLKEFHSDLTTLRMNLIDGRTNFTKGGVAYNSTKYLKE